MNALVSYLFDYIFIVSPIPLIYLVSFSNVYVVITQKQQNIQWRLRMCEKYIAKKPDNLFQKLKKALIIEAGMM